jgi:hypothetical protein
MDIRNPRLDEYLNLPEPGFTNYLSSKDLMLEDLIVSMKDTRISMYYQQVWFRQIQRSYWWKEGR